MRVVLLSALVLTLVSGDDKRIHAPGYCMMYDVGDPSTWHPAGGSLTKFSNAPARDLDTITRSLLTPICPDIAKQDKVCCSIGQISSLISSTSAAKSLLSKCEVSWNNFVSLFCMFTCSPDQSLILNVTKTEKSKDNDWYNVIETDMLLTKEYKIKYYNSIKDVTLPSANMKAIVALCGSSKCDEDHLFDFIGDNPAAPFIVNYVTEESPAVPDNGTMVALNESTLKYCYEKATSTSWLCSCEDCPSNYTCPATPVPPPVKKPFLIMGYDGPLIVLLVIYLALFVICLVHLSINLHYKRRNEMDPMTRSASIASSISEKHIEALQSQVNKGCRRVDDILHIIFTKWARFSISHPFVIVAAAVCIVATCCAGMNFFVMTSAPIDLWSSPKSQTRLEKEKFDVTFTPFYRTAQIIVTAPRTPSFNYTIHSSILPEPEMHTFSGVFSHDVFLKIFQLQQGVMNVVAHDGNETITIKDVCFIPLDPDVKECAVISPFQWFQNKEANIKKVIDTGGVHATYLEHVYTCVTSPLNIADGSFDNLPCVATFFGPAPVHVALGGFDGENYLEAQAIVISIPLNNNANESLNRKAELWEKAYIEYMKGFNDSDLDFAFQAERSIQDELEREAFQDIYTVGISYFLMFGYVALMLGKVSCCSGSNVQLYCIRRWFVDAKVSLGLAGVLFVLLSVVSSLGIFSYAGYKSTVIVMEVIPFLVLAVGVDNIFILVQAIQRDIKPSSENTNDQIVRIFGDVGPSMLLSAFSEIIAFSCGSLSTQPAVHDFSLYASVAVLINFLLQISVFLVLLSVDKRREIGERMDVFCCIKASAEIHIPDGVARPRSPLYLLVSKVWVPALLGTTIVRFLVMSLFGLTFCLSIAAIPHLQIGLDQQLALPKDSYMGPYFDYLSKYLEVGAPVYFVVEHGDLDVSYQDGQNELCGVSGCDMNSLVTMLTIYANVSAYSRLGQPPNSWIDDYFSWLEPQFGDSCCQLYNTGPKAGNFCSTEKSYEASCDPCIASSAEYPNHRPSPDQFNSFLDFYLHDNPTIDYCTKGGHAAYGDAVNYTRSTVKGKMKPNITASYFMAYHTTCRNSSDFIEAYKGARNLSNLMSEQLNVTIYPYSVFYVYYEMYVDMVNQVAINLSVCITAVFIVSFVLLNFNFMAAVITTTTVLMITVNMLGMMYLLDININPVSLVNLVMSVGISVEFCSHITRSFSLSRHPHRVDRAKEALAKTGSSVLSGIFMTKIIGISVLAFAKSQIFEIYYFKMYVCIVALGMLHGLVFLPVFLTFFGPARNTLPISTAAYKPIDTSSGPQRGPSEKSPLLI